MTLTAVEVEERRTRLGASEFPIVAGLYPGKTALDIYAQKVLAAPSDSTRFTQWGQRLEAVVAEAYTEQTGIPVERHGQVVRHPVEAWCGATPDYRALIKDRRLLEIKTGDSRTAHQWGESGTDQVPDRVLAQVVIQMACENADLADVAVLLGGNDLRIYHLARDRQLEDTMLELGKEFWFGHIVPKVPPEIDGSESSRRFLGLLFPHHDLMLLDAPQAVLDVVQALKLAEAVATPAADDVARLENELKSMIGAGMGFKLPSGEKVTWKEQKGRPSWKAIAEELGATAAHQEQHRGESYRVLNASWRRAK